MTLTIKQKELLKEYVSFTCEVCHKKKESKNLICHHIHRVCQNGLDSFRNIQVICKDCNKLIHFKEFKRSGG